jgi:hypothetical protein
VDGKSHDKERQAEERGKTESLLRPLGLCASEFVVPDDYDAPLPESFVEEFEGR